MADASSKSSLPRSRAPLTTHITRTASPSARCSTSQRPANSARAFVDLGSRRVKVGVLCECRYTKDDTGKNCVSHGNATPLGNRKPDFLQVGTGAG